MTISVGDTYTTKFSQYTGVVTDIFDPASNGRTVLELDHGVKYTTL